MLTVDRQNTRFFPFSACFLAKRVPPDGFQACKNGFSVCGNDFHVCRNGFPVCKNGFPACRNDFTVCRNRFSVCENGVVVCKNEVTVCELGVRVCRNGVAVCKFAVTVCELKVTARKGCFTMCIEDAAMRCREVAMYKPEPTAPPEHLAMPPESLLWTAGGISAMSPVAELENLLITVAANLPALTGLPYAASNARQAASSFFKFALVLASM